jgi:putative methionine-R-sulfoxide reductase with GAF domain
LQERDYFECLYVALQSGAAALNRPASSLGVHGDQALHRRIRELEGENRQLHSRLEAFAEGAMQALHGADGRLDAPPDDVAAQQFALQPFQALHKTMRELYARELESRRRIAKLQARLRERDETHRLMTQQLGEMRQLQALLHAQAIADPARLQPVSAPGTSTASKKRASTQTLLELSTVADRSDVFLREVHRSIMELCCSYNVDELDRCIDSIRSFLRDSDKKYEQSLMLIAEFTRLMEEFDLDRVIEQLAASCCAMVNADRCTIYILDHNRMELWSKVAKGSSEVFRVPVGRGIAGTVAKTQETINIVDAYEDSRFNKSFDQKTGYRTRAILCRPVWDAHGTVIAVFQLINKLDSPQFFTEADEELLSSFAKQAGNVLSALQHHGGALRFQEKFKMLCDTLHHAHGSEHPLDLLDVLTVRVRGPTRCRHERRSNSRASAMPSGEPPTCFRSIMCYVYSLRECPAMWPGCDPSTHAAWRSGRASAAPGTTARLRRGYRIAWSRLEPSPGVDVAGVLGLVPAGAKAARG